METVFADSRSDVKPFMKNIRKVLVWTQEASLQFKELLDNRGESLNEDIKLERFGTNLGSARLVTIEKVFDNIRDGGVNEIVDGERGGVSLLT